MKSILLVIAANWTWLALLGVAGASAAKLAYRLPPGILRDILTLPMGSRHTAAEKYHPSAVVRIVAPIAALALVVGFYLTLMWVSSR